MAFITAMKTLLILVVSTLFVSWSAAADKKVDAPRGSFAPAAYADAKAKAVSEKKLIVYLWTDLNSDCPKCQAGNEGALRAFKNNRKYVLVFCSTKSSDGAPEILLQALNATVAKVGNTIPVVMIIDPATDKPLASACYKQFANDERIWKKIQREAEAAAGLDKK